MDDNHDDDDDDDGSDYVPGDDVSFSKQDNNFDDDDDDDSDYYPTEDGGEDDYDYDSFVYNSNESVVMISLTSSMS